MEKKAYRPNTKPLTASDVLAAIEEARTSGATQLILGSYHQGVDLTSLPLEICGLVGLKTLEVYWSDFTHLPPEIGALVNLEILRIYEGNLVALPPQIGKLSRLEELALNQNELESLPPEIGGLKKLSRLHLYRNRLTTLPPEIGDAESLTSIGLQQNRIASLPAELSNLQELRHIALTSNPLPPELESAWKQGVPALQTYLRSLADSEPLFEAKLVLVGEGGVGKTTLLKALSGGQPREGERTTHGVSIDVHAMFVAHPSRPGVRIDLNAWDFGGQEVYRVTHQFFFSKRSIYLLVWEPRLGVQQCQVEDWLRLIRLRVGHDARVIIVSTHAKTGLRLARIDEATFRRDFGHMIIGFIEVDSLVGDPATGDNYGFAQLKAMIAASAADLEHMGMRLNTRWRTARDELMRLGQATPRIDYAQFERICKSQDLELLEAQTLAGLMHDLGYIVYYADDEQLKNDVVLQPEWLTKAIGFVLEDRTTQESNGILADERLRDVWLNHPFTGEPRFEPPLYAFFLRLMEKYDVSYRLKDGTGSLIAQHVPQVRPELPWGPEDESRPEMRRLSMICVMDESPPGLMPWMIVRCQDYSYQRAGRALHWQKGMFLRNNRHGEALIELQGREVYLHAEAVWPEYFMNVLRQTLATLIKANWPGLEGRYSFTVPCSQFDRGRACQGRFDITALRQFLEEGDDTIRCQVCRTRQQIVALLFGFEEESPKAQLARIEAKLDGGFDRLRQDGAALESRLANYVMAIMRAVANEARNGPRLFDLQPVDRRLSGLRGKRWHLRLWCEASGCQHPVLVDEMGVYEIADGPEWMSRVAPYARLVTGVLKALVPVVAPAVDVLFGSKTTEGLGIKDRLDFMKAALGALPSEKQGRPDSKDVLSDDERSGLLALHDFLHSVDPHHARLGLRRVPTYTGDYIWLCPIHHEMSQSNIPTAFS